MESDANFPPGEVTVAQVRVLLNGPPKQHNLRILVVEDSPSLSGLLIEAFNAVGYRADPVSCLAEARAALGRSAYDVVVLDYRLPDGLGDDLIVPVFSEQPECAIIMMTSDSKPGLALEWMKRGVSAYLRKPFEPAYLLELCARARRERALLRVRELLKARTRELRFRETKLKQLFESTPIGIFRTTSRGRVLSMNSAAASILGFSSPDEAIARYSNLESELYADAARRKQFLELLQSGGTVNNFVYEARTDDGRHIWLSMNARISEYFTDGSFLIEGFLMDITHQKRSEEALRVLAESTWGREEDIFRFLVRQLAVSQGVRYAFLARIDADDPETAHTMAVWNGSKFARNISYSLKGSPCQTVLEQGSCFCPRGAGRLFSGDHFLSGAEVESYWGTPLKDSSGNVIGILAILDARPMESKTHYMALFNSFAVRAAAELERRRTVEALRKSEKWHRTILHMAMDGFWVGDIDGNLLDVNEAYCQMSGYSSEELRDMKGFDLDAGDTSEMPVPNLKKALGVREDRFETRHRRKDGSLYDVEVSAQFLPFDGGRRVAFIRDITERKRGEEETARLEVQLQQARKMESIGQLAGGVAHDFNNILSVIMGHVDLAYRLIDPEGPLHSHLEQIGKAAERSAALVRQLLAFARRQPVSPRVLDLNDAVSGTLKMLQRLIGEAICLDWIPCGETWRVNMDPSQIDQILANLCVNARDAIAGVGRISIETGNVRFNEEYCRLHTGFLPGEYVMLAVSDSGCGMSRETLSRVFEPFFTTKDVGEGTGLGLSTVYGITKQNKGFINVYSEPGSGTRITVYFPRHEGDIDCGPEMSRDPADARGSETILLVEDEPGILQMTRMMLEEQGYCVLEAEGPGEAIQKAADSSNAIHLLLSDVIMPEMNGRDLLEKLKPLMPGLKHLFMSGYTANVVARHGILDDGLNFIHKPFSMKALGEAVRTVLDGGQIRK